MRAGEFSFSAIVGMERVKRSLLLQLVNPACGGVLISGPSGTGKSLVVNSVAGIAPEKNIFKLPLGATEDMVFGSLDMESALAGGNKRVIPGLLHRAGRSILFMDNVNLLAKDFVRAVCSSYRAGFFELQRDGVAYRENVEFSPVGAMSPEEGILSPWELDCFGIFVTTENILDAERRAQISRLWLEYADNPDGLLVKYRSADEKITDNIIKARALLSEIVPARAICLYAAQVCAKANLAGNIGEIYLLEVAKAIAALAGRHWLMPQDIDEAALYVLPHRMRKNAENQPPNPEDDFEDKDREHPTADVPPESKQEGDSQMNAENSPMPSQGDRCEVAEDNSLKENGNLDKVFSALANVAMPRLTIDTNKKLVISGRGRRLKSLSKDKHGRYVGYTPKGNKPLDLAIDATLKAAAPYQIFRKAQGSNQRVIIRPEDYQNKIREKRSGINLLFVVDASGSMGARQRMRMVKGAILTLLMEAYQRRDSVGLIAFRRDRAELLLPITRSVELAQKKLQELPVGGRTPLAEGLECALTQLAGITSRDKSQRNVLIIITDGRVNSTYKGDDPITRAVSTAKRLAFSQADIVVIDSESGFVRLGIAKMLAQEMGASYYPLREVTTQSVLRIVQGIKQGI